METLTEIESMHEQRERFGEPTIVKEGIWIEVLDFDSNTEQVDIKHRWEVLKIEKTIDKDIEKYKVRLKILKIKSYEDNKKKIAKRVLEKHKNLLKASFAKCLVQGIEVNSIPDLKHMLNKLGGKNDN